MTRPVRYYRGDIVTAGDPYRTWTVRGRDGTFVRLRDDRGALCSVPASTLHLVQSAPPGPIWVAIGAVFAFAAICAACVWRVASGQVALDRVTCTVLLSIASVSVIAWMIALLRGAWRRL